MLLSIVTVFLMGQGVTRGSIVGIVYDDQDILPEVSVIAVHTDSGTKYATVTQDDGSFSLPNVKIGGPYEVTFSFIGLDDYVEKNVYVNLGEKTELIINFSDSNKIGEVVLTGEKGNLIDSRNTGATSKFDAAKIEKIPNIDRSTEGFVRLTPQASGSGFLGQSNKQNFVTIDGASFNNAFGLGGANLLPGGNTNAQPISIEAIEQVQVSLSPFDVRQAGFTGTGINTVTKSGDNHFHGSAYTYFRNQDMMGYKVEDDTLEKTDMSNWVHGFTLSGPIIKNKLFFFANYESSKRKEPVFNTVAGREGLSGDNVSSIQASTLDQLSNYLINTYNYNPGRYEGYDRTTESEKFLIKLDWNINDNHQASIRYSQLNSSLSHVDVNFGSTNVNFENFGWKRNLDTYSIVGELNSTLHDNLTNRFFVSYNSLPEYRTPQSGQTAPFTIINDNGLSYTLGTHPAALGNRVEQKFLQIQNDVTWLLERHELTAGISYEHMNFSNEFTLFNSGFYIFNSFDSFYNNAPTGTSTPIGTSTGNGQPFLFQYRYPLDRGRITTYTNPKFSQLGFYLQDEFDVTSNLKLTGGLRFDVTSFINSPEENSDVTNMTFQDANGNLESFNTSKLPDSKVLISPRLGFNWNALNRKLQVRGGTGIFTGRIPFVFIEKQFSQNGLVEGEIAEVNNTNTLNYPWTSDVSGYRPSNSSAISNYTLALVDPDFKMPQVWRSDLGIDFKLPKNIIATAEFIYSKDINAAYYRNANLDHTNPGVGPNRQYVFSDNRIHDNIAGAYVLDNTNKGYAYSITGKLEKEFSKNWAASIAYSYNQAENVNDLNSSLPDRAYDRNPIEGNGDLETLSNSLYGPKHNVVGSAAYVARWNDWTSSTFSFFFKGSQDSRSSYVYSGSDINGDGSNRNDLIFVPQTINDINLVENNGVSVEEQWNALNNFISNSDYLSSRRGQFAERNGVIAPFYFQVDAKYLQDFYINVGEKKHNLQLSLDIFNLTNLLNKDWGIIETPRTTTPIQAVSATEFTVNTAILNQSEFVNITNELSRWRMQIGLKYSF